MNKWTLGVVAAVGAAYVASTGHDGWGWLIVVAVMVAAS